MKFLQASRQVAGRLRVSEHTKSKRITPAVSSRSRQRLPYLHKFDFVRLLIGVKPRRPTRSRKGRGTSFDFDEFDGFAAGPFDHHGAQAAEFVRRLQKPNPF